MTVLTLPYRSLMATALEQPRNYLLLACHASNEAAQCYQLSRWAALPKKKEN